MFVAASLSSWLVLEHDRSEDLLITGVVCKVGWGFGENFSLFISWSAGEKNSPLKDKGKRIAAMW